MNHHYVNNSTALLQFRLRTARHKKRAQYEDWDKQLLALQRERNALYKQQRDLGWIALHPPVMRGWKRYFVLRDNVARSKQASFFESILSKINTTQYSHRKDFKVKRRKWGKKVYVVKEQHLLQPQTFCFNKMKFTEAEKQFFEERMVHDQWASKPYKIYVFTEPWRFVLPVRPNIITKTRARDEPIESRIQQINNYLENGALIGRLNHLSNGRRNSWYDEEKRKERNPLKNKSLAVLLDEYYVKEHDT
jgi:hypothetical protein